MLQEIDRLNCLKLTSDETAMLRMFYHTVWPFTTDAVSMSDIQERLKDLSNSPVMLCELIELLEYNYSQIDFIDEQVNLGFPSPLDLHCTYTRDQLLIGLGHTNPSSVREGVLRLKEKHCDVFFITLNKSSKDYSPTTMYKDYSINESLFHWQSQSTTSEDSPTGKRYQQHGKGTHQVLLFVRDSKMDLNITSPYTFLGLAEYVSHEGSRPMSITYRLKRPIPAKYLKKTNKLLVG